ncbi:unnamed protein product [Ixodes hexagonus]
MARGSLFGVVILSWAASKVCSTRDNHPDPGTYQADSALLKLENSLIKFESSLHKFEDKSLGILNLDSEIKPSVELRPGLRMLREKQRETNGRWGAAKGDASRLAARYVNQSKHSVIANQSKHSVIANHTDDDTLFQKKKDGGVRIIRIKIIRHQDEVSTDGTSSSLSKDPNATLTGHSTSEFGAKCGTAAALRLGPNHIAPTTVRAMPVRKKERTTQSVPGLAGGRYCAKTEEHAKILLEVARKTASPTEHVEDGTTMLEGYENYDGVVTTEEDEKGAHEVPHHHEEATLSDGDDDTDTPTPDKLPGCPHMISSLGEQASIKTTMRLFRNHKETSRTRNYHTPGRVLDRLQVHVGQKLPNAQKAQNSANKTNSTNSLHRRARTDDTVLLRANDHFKVDDASRTHKIRKSGALTRDTSGNDAEVKLYIRDFERRVKQVNESLQRIRNVDHPDQWTKTRSRRAGIPVHSTKTLRLAPRGVVTLNKTLKSQAKARQGNFRVMFSREQTTEGSNTTLPSSNQSKYNKERRGIPAGKKADANLPREHPNDSSKSRSNVGIQNLELALAGFMKRDGDGRFPSVIPGGGIKVPPNKSQEQDPLLGLLSQVATQIDYRASLQPESKFTRLRNRALVLTCVLSAASVFTVVVVLTMLYFDVQKCLQLKRGVRYVKYDMSIPLRDYLEESKPLTQ